MRQFIWRDKSAILKPGLGDEFWFLVPVTKNVDALKSESKSESEREGRELLIRTWNKLQYKVIGV